MTLSPQNFCVNSYILEPESDNHPQNYSLWNIVHLATVDSSPRWQFEFFCIFVYFQDSI